MNIKGKSSILQKIVFELRYRYGFTYLDKCGRTINAIMREHPEWMISGDPNPQTTGLVSLQTGCLFNFSAPKCDFALEKPLGGDPISDQDFSGFVEQVALISGIVFDQLGLKEFTRIGFRAWHLFGCQNREEAENWLHSLDCYSISPNLSSAFEGEIEATSVVVVITGTDRKFRIAFNAVESHVELDLGQEILRVQASSLSKDQDKFLRKQMETKRRMRANPEYAAMIDMDAFQETPISVDPRDFIETSVKQFSDLLGAAVSK